MSSTLTTWLLVGVIAATVLLLFVCFLLVGKKNKNSTTQTNNHFTSSQKQFSQNASNRTAKTNNIGGIKVSDSDTDSFERIIRLLKLYKVQNGSFVEKPKVKEEVVELEPSGMILSKEQFTLSFALNMIKVVGTFWGFKIKDSKTFVLSRIEHLKFEEVEEMDEIQKAFKQGLQVVLKTESITFRHHLFSDIDRISFEFGQDDALESITIKSKHDTSYIVELTKKIFGEPSFYCDEIKCSPVWLIRDMENLFISKYSNGEITYHYRFLYS